jgi:glucoamylase
LFFISYKKVHALYTNRLEPLLWDYARLSRHLQELPVESGIGEPKFLVDGSPFREGWCRPQNDGPALEASTLIRFAKAYLQKGGSLQKVKEQLYDGRYPSSSVIKVNLEFVANKWQETNTCDLVNNIFLCTHEIHFY